MPNIHPFENYRVNPHEDDEDGDFLRWPGIRGYLPSSRPPADDLNMQDEGFGEPELKE